MFNLFSGCSRCNAQPSCSACARQVSELWTQATEMEKAPYIALANIDRMRYQSELEAFNYRCRGAPAACGQDDKHV